MRAMAATGGSARSCRHGWRPDALEADPIPRSRRSMDVLVREGYARLSSCGTGARLTRDGEALLRVLDDHAARASGRRTAGSGGRT